MHKRNYGRGGGVWRFVFVLIITYDISIHSKYVICMQYKILVGLESGRQQRV